MRRFWAARGGKRRPYHHGDLRRALLDEARALIGEEGLAGFSVRAVARRAGVTHAAAYRHFADREDLLAAIAHAGYEALGPALLADVAAGAPLDERLDAMGRSYVRFALQRPADYQVMFGPRLNESRRHPGLEKAIQSLFAPVAAELAREAPVSAERARDAAVSLLVQAHGYAELVQKKRIRVRGRAAAERYFSQLLRPFLAGLVAELGAHS